MRRGAVRAGSGSFLGLGLLVLGLLVLGLLRLGLLGLGLLDVGTVGRSLSGVLASQGVCGLNVAVADGGELLEGDSGEVEVAGGDILAL